MIGLAWVCGEGDDALRAGTVIRTPERPPVASFLNPVRMVRLFVEQRDLIRQFAVRFFVARHKGTALGAAWALVFPLLMLAVYTFVFVGVFGVRWGGPEEPPMRYVVALFCGIMIFQVFSETCTRAATLITDHPNLVKKVIFPVEVLPVAQLGSSLLSASFGFVLAFLAAAFVLGSVGWPAVFFPLTLFPLLAMALGVGWFVASLGVYVRDATNVVVLVVQQVLFFMTPVLYRVESIPERFRWIARVNPMTPIVDAARRTLVFGETPDWAGFLGACAVSLVVLQLGYAWFMLTRRGFADVL
jgi:lipopolysaccharide transport system permease protein